MDGLTTTIGELTVANISEMQIHADIAAKLNFAAHQSAFPVLRSLQVEIPIPSNALKI